MIRRTECFDCHAFGVIPDAAAHSDFPRQRARPGPKANTLNAPHDANSQADFALASFHDTFARATAFT